MKGQGDRSLPRSMSETGRRSVGNRKEHRLRCDYASSPDSGPWQGSGAGPLSGVWGGNPNVPQGEAQRNAAEQPPEAAFSAEAGISEKHRMNTQRPFPYLCNTGAERSAVFIVRSGKTARSASRRPAGRSPPCTASGTCPGGSTGRSAAGSRYSGSDGTARGSAGPV